MEEALKFYREHYYQILMADIAFGLLIGLIPLILGIKKQKRGLGIVGLIVSIVLAAFTPILSIVSVVIFTIIILRNSKPAEVVVVNDKPIDVSVKDSDNL